jgi:lysophospholipase L1-like esterase
LIVAGSLGLAIGAVGCGGGSPTSPTPQTPPVQTPTTPTPPVNPPPAPAPPPVLTATRFVAFGDSLTEGVTSLDLATQRKALASQPYPQLLQSLLSDRYTTQTFTIQNRGHAGEQAQDGMSRLIDVLRQDQPQVLLLLEGFNDLTAFGSKGITRAIGSIESMIKEARGRGVKVFLATLPPERASSPKALPSDLFEKFNSELAKTAQDEGATLVDLSHMVTVAAIGDDGVHPTDSGYQQLASAYFTVVRATLEAPPSTMTATSGKSATAIAVAAGAGAGATPASSTAPPTSSTSGTSGTSNGATSRGAQPRGR